jgi:hypothetical protein
MLETNEDSAAAALAVSVPVTAPLWKAPRSVADTQSPIKLETVTDFDSGFIPYEIEYGVVMQLVPILVPSSEELNIISI